MNGFFGSLVIAVNYIGCTFKAMYCEFKRICNNNIIKICIVKDNKSVLSFQLFNIIEKTFQEKHE